MIKTFRDRNTEELFRTGACRRFPQEIQRSGKRRLNELHAARALADLRGAGNSIEKHRDGRWAMRVNDKYRLLFFWEGADAFEAEITDPH